MTIPINIGTRVARALVLVAQADKHARTNRNGKTYDFPSYLNMLAEKAKAAKQGDRA